jgi:hypothetical protein
MDPAVAATEAAEWDTSDEAQSRDTVAQHLVVADDALDEDADQRGIDQLEAHDVGRQEARRVQDVHDAQRQVAVIGDEVDLARGEDSKIDSRVVDEQLGEAVPDASKACYPSIWSDSACPWCNVREGLRFADDGRTGLVNINETTNEWENHLPFGGRAGTDSGTGPRRRAARHGAADGASDRGHRLTRCSSSFLGLGSVRDW